MSLNGSTIMILGGGGLVGRAAGRRLLACAPLRLLPVSRTERGAVGGASGSDQDWLACEPSEPVVPSRIAPRIFPHGDAGERIKR